MSYLNLPKGIPDFSQAVISFWFRVPKASIAAAAADDIPAPTGIPLEHGQGGGDAFPNLKNVIPFITFGAEGSQKRKGGVDYPSRTPIEGGSKTFAAVTVSNKTPSFIGIKCSGTEDDEDDPLTASLVINLQMLGYGNGEGAFYTPPDASQNPPPAPGISPDSVSFSSTSKGGVSAGTIYTEEVIHIEVPKGFVRDDELEGEPSPDDVTPDQWHHVLISFDLSIPIESTIVKSSLSFSREFDTPFGMKGPKLWLAYDDINYDGEAFGNSWPQTNKFIPPKSYPRNLVTSPNGGLLAYIWDYSTQTDYYDYGLPFGAMSYAIHYAHELDPNGQYRQVRQFDPRNPDSTSPQGGLYLDAATPQPGGWKYEDGKIEAEDHPISIPAAEAYVDRIHRIEMAEFQLFTGITLDTSKDANRRVFIAPDDDGLNLKPVKPSKAEELLGQKPAILLHGSGNWKTGKNTGSLGFDEDGNENPDGQFGPVGGIESYKPDPSITVTPDAGL